MTTSEDLIYLYKRQGIDIDPYVDIQENIVVQYGKAFLKEVPDTYFKVSVANGATYLNEVYIESDLINNTYFYVDYKQGIVYFHSTTDGLNLQFTYKGKGTILYPASRIYTSLENGVTETLKDAVDDALSSSSQANALIQQVNDQMVEVNANSDYAKQQGDYAKAQGESIDTSVTNAETATTNANAKIIEMDNKINDASTAIENVDLAKTNAETATTNVNNAVSNFVHKGEYDSSITYMPRNIVSYDGSSYMNIVSCTDILPTDTSKWKLTGSKGNQGIQGIQGVGFSWRGIYTPSTSYMINDIVSFNGSTYIAIQSTTGNDPTDTIYWDLYTEKGVDGTGTVNSVNGQDGIVVLTASDVGAETPEGSQAKVDAHADDIIKHITSTERTTWNAKSDFSGNYTDLTNKPTIPTNVSQLTNDSGYVEDVNGRTIIDIDSVNNHIDNNVIHVTQTDKDNWNAKETTNGSQTKANSAEQNAKVYTDQQITQVSSSGVPKLNVYSYEIVATSDNQTDFPIELSIFDTSTDTLQVIQKRTILEPSAYTVIDPESDGTYIVRLGEGVAIDSNIVINVWKNVPIGNDGAINGRVLAVGSVPQDRVVGLEDELSKQSAMPITLQRGTQTVTANQDTPFNVLSLNGKTVTNLSPLFDSGLWILGGTTNPTVTQVSPSKITLQTTTTGQSYNVLLNVKASTTYVFSTIANDGGLATIAFVDGTGADTSFPVSNQPANNTYTVTTPSDITKLRIYLTSGGTGTFTFENIILNEGATAQEFVANVKGLTNLTIENKTTNESITLVGTFHEGDAISQADDGLRVTRVKKEMVLDGSLAWAYVNDYTGFKTVRFPISNDVIDSGQAIKYNGKIIPKVYPPTLGDQMFHSGGYFTVTIADTDSGWGETYSPTADEIKAYFLGWKMFDYVSGNGSTLYTTGTKGWTYRKDDGTWGQSVTALPTTQAEINSKWQPYRLIYDLATPITEPIQTIGSVTLQKGDNQIEVTEGRIVREVAKVGGGTSDYGGYWVINLNDGTVHNPLTYKVSDIVHVYKNGKVDSGWEKVTDTMAYGNYIVRNKNFDPTAVYTVDYIPLEPYKVSPNTNPISAEYQSNLGSVVSQLVDDTANHDGRIEIVERDMVRKNEGIQWIAPTLLNGWVNYGGSNYDNIGYYKDSLGIVHIKGLIKSGTSTNGTTLFQLPIGYRPNKWLLMPSISYNGSSTNSPTSIDVQNNGIVSIGILASNVWLSLNLLFKAEQ